MHAEKFRMAAGYSPDGRHSLTYTLVQNVHVRVGMVHTRAPSAFVDAPVRRFRTPRGAGYRSRMASASHDAMPLTEVAVYRRTVRAAVASVWENVRDWEHLPWLHRTTFRAVDLLAESRDGWRARVALQPGGADDEAVIDLRIDRAASRYVARTAEGAGRGTEIWTDLAPLAGGRTSVTVRFLVPGVAPDRAARIGRGYVALYTRLWDEDEGMMARREELLGAAAGGDAAPAPDVAELGRRAAVRARLPLLVEVGGRAYRLVEIDGALVAHATVCPHMLGPLAEAPLEDGCVRCPWHGYRFDARTGRSADGRRLRLPPAPRVEVDPATSDVRLTFG